MNYAKVTAIVRSEKLERIEERVTAEGARGMSVTEVRGCGELKDFFNKDWLVNHARVEIFTRADRAERLAQAIMEEAATGEAGDGIVAILPVQQVYRIRTRAPLVEPGS
ncbi:P-II family nitrogen regulator [Thiohalobacter sp.]|uniref:P-II family nitrogen regulator n=1 Tax=Thiohalobacter sp. TaxID=2025948 RepID=UPI002621A31A|nr:P-II family nitrogen regulator [Thiohalobacter sp.]